MSLSKKKNNFLPPSFVADHYLLFVEMDCEHMEFRVAGFFPFRRHFLAPARLSPPDV